MKETNTPAALLTYILNDGTVVLGKKHNDKVHPYTFANYKQAEVQQVLTLATGTDCAVYLPAYSRVWYVTVNLPAETKSNTDMEITRTTYNAADGPATEKPFKLDADNLASALSQAIDYAKQPNSENFDACSLAIQQGNVFWITGRCYRNTVFSRFLHKVPQMTLTVPADAIIAQAWPFDLIEFCGYYGIKISTVEWTDHYGKPRVPVWASVDPLHGL